MLIMSTLFQSHGEDDTCSSTVSGVRNEALQLMVVPPPTKPIAVPSDGAPPKQSVMPNPVPKPTSPRSTGPEALLTPPAGPTVSVPQPKPVVTDDVRVPPEVDPTEDQEPAWPTTPLPEEARLRGAWLEEGVADPAWRVFTIEGIYAELPPATPTGTDWGALARRTRVTTYSRDGERLSFADRGTPVDIVRDNHLLRMDGRTFRRTDWNLTGRGMAGTWVDPLGVALVLGEDLTLGHGTRHGTYALGIGEIVIAWDGGGRDQLTFLSNLRPYSSSPSLLWWGGERCAKRPGDTEATPSEVYGEVRTKAAGEYVSTLKIVCPSCRADYGLLEPFPSPGVRIRCLKCAAVFAITYPAGILELLEKRGKRIAPDTTGIRFIPPRADSKRPP